MADATSKTVRIKGRDFHITHMLAEDALVVYMRLVALGSVTLTGGVGKGAEGLEVYTLAAKAFAADFRIADLQENGDLHPLLTCIRMDGQAGSIAGTWSVLFAGRLSELLAVVKEAVAFNFPDFTGALARELLDLFAGALTQALKDQAEKQG
jgi:hypothetical protein